MRLDRVTMAIAALQALGFAATGSAQSKSKSPAEVSAEAAEEDPTEQGMEEDDTSSSATIQDKTGSASGIGLDKSPLGSGGKDEDASGSASDPLDEAADDILDQSFSQPGIGQDTGHARKQRTGGAAVAVPEQEQPLPGVELKEKESPKRAAKEKETIVIKDKDVIIKMQKALIKRGAKIKADGVMGASTIEALKAFQKQSGLKADGNPGPATLTKLGIVYIAK